MGKKLYSANDISSSFYPNVTAQFYPIYYEMVDPSSNLAKHLYYLSSYYANSTPYNWYNYDDIMISSPNVRYSNNIQIYAALMMDNIITTDNVTINVRNEVDKAYEKLYKLHLVEDNQFYWYLGEDANTLLTINKYFDNIIAGW